MNARLALWSGIFAIVLTLGSLARADEKPGQGSALDRLKAGVGTTSTPGRVLPEGKLPADRRLEPLKTLNDYFPFEVPKTAEEWMLRAQAVRQQVLVSQGLWPMPTRTPAQAVVHGRVTRDDFTVDRVYLQSVPGHYVTGSLFRPIGKGDKLPAVLCPHGHWPNGRFMDTGEKKGQQEVEAGAEQSVEAARNVLQARCIQLARMGCVVFLYDMIGYADSQQLAHRPGWRESMNTAKDWGFFSPQAELRLQTMMGLQTYNSICALDFLLAQPEVDKTRVGVTGASGGGTQTFVLCAVDSRPTVAHPAVMVSTAMQGGCTCENGNYLRVGTGNIELAGLFAPKPLSMTAANDWTKEIKTKGLPELQKLYGMMGAPDNVLCEALVQFPHNYNYVSRKVMYGWFNKHLQLRQPEPIVEHDYQRLSQDELTVWGKDHSKPASGDDYERSLLGWMTADADKQMAALAPQSSSDWARWRDVIGGGWKVLIGRELPKPDDIEYEKVGEHDRGSYLEFTALLRNKKHGEEVPTVFLLPKKWNKQVVIWVDGNGKGALYDAAGGPMPNIEYLLDQGIAVAGIDLFGQGEFIGGEQKLLIQRLVSGPKIGPASQYAGYTFGYNHPLLSQRAHDILTLVTFVRNYKQKPERVVLMAGNGAAPYAAAACAVAGEALDGAAIETQGFRFAELTAFDDPNFVPGAVKYGDMDGLLSLIAPTRLLVLGDKDKALPKVLDAYKAADAKQRLSITSKRNIEEMKVGKIMRLLRGE